MVSRDAVLMVLKNVEDPEIMLNIVDLGLVYRVDVTEDSIEVDYTLTYPGCPAEEMIRRDIVETLRDAFGVPEIKANVVWSPMWGPERMSEEARIALGYPI